MGDQAYRAGLRIFQPHPSSKKDMGDPRYRKGLPMFQSHSPVKNKTALGSSNKAARGAGDWNMFKGY